MALPDVARDLAEHRDLDTVLARIAAHGGQLGAANNTDRGATFWFTLPAGR